MRHYLFYVATVLKILLDQVYSCQLRCGEDYIDTEMRDGPHKIENFPWIGVLYYPFGNKSLTTTVVLVTKQVVLAAAAEIDKFPKSDFRRKSKVILSRNCSGPGIPVRDYVYHPDYAQNTYSSLTMVQLETDGYKGKLRPICPPPAYFSNQYFYAMVLSNNCNNSTITLHTMEYVSNESCNAFYRRTGLDVKSIWPTHTVCAKSVSEGHCIWRSGVILIVRVGGRWRLLGFGVYGPGCNAPSRFIDYGKYYNWLKQSVFKIGRTTVSEIAANHVIMRRTYSNLQRYGPCDKEEKKKRLYDDETIIGNLAGTATYNHIPA